MCQVAARLAQLDQGLQAQAALENVFFGQHRFVQAELFHQGAFLRLADFHAQWLDFLGRHHSLDSSRLFGKFCFDV